MTRLDRTEATFETSPARLAGGVVLPSTLNDALASDNLAVFVGAGASVEPPAALPLFKDMTETVLGLGGSVDPPAEDGRFDVQLGDLADASFDVRGAVRRIIGVVDSEPNRWHSALTGLWPEPPLIRIVTTNYDVHLEGTAGSLAASWSAPALPLGHCFTGIVHLHGSLAGADEGFVVTDRDFGRAYLTEGWARRFLVGLFRRYVVLFVGYSHSDFVMQYLARGLPPDSQARYALVKSDEDPAKWERLRITPISWEDESRDPYGPAVTALREWGKRTRWTHLEHDDHIQLVVARGPLVNPVEDSYLTRALEDEVMTTIFCRHTSGESWLTWIAAKPDFRVLFDRSANLSPSQMRLARWFAEEHVIKGDGAALRVLAEAGGTLSTGLWYAIADAIQRQRPVQPGEFQAWVTVLIDQIHKRDDSLLSYLAKECILPDDHQPLMALLRALFEPRLRLRPGCAIDVLADSHWMAEILEKLLEPAIETVAEDVFEIATSSLMKYNNIYRSFGHGTDSYDLMSLQRSAIEPHEQDHHNDDALFAVDLAREAAVALARVHGLSEVANRLLARRVPLLTRIAVWVVGEGDPSGGPDAKLCWLLDHGLLEDLFLRHEVFGLLEKSFADATAETKQAVWDRAWAAYESTIPQDGDIEPAVAIWLNRIDPDFEPAARAVAEFSESHLDWTISEHPEFLSRMEIGERPRREPLGADERNFDYLHDRDLEETSALAQSDLEDSVSAAVVEKPLFGVELLEDIATASAWDSVLWRASMRGLSHGGIPPDAWSRLLAAIRDHPEPALVLEELSSLLLDQAQSEPPGIPSDSISVAATTLNELMCRFLDQGLDIRDPGQDLMFGALNSWPGRIAQYLALTAAQLESGDEDDPCGAPGLDDFVRRVQQAGEANWAQVANAALGRLFPYLWERCQSSIREPLIAQLSFGSPVIARAAWSGLGYAQWNRPTVDALYEQLPTMASELPGLEEQSRRGLITVLVGIATNYGNSPTASDGWLSAFVRANDDSALAHFAHGFGRRLAELTEQERLKLWDDWLRKYWQMRIEGFPCGIGPEEGSMMLTWTFPLRSRLTEVEPLILGAPLSLRTWGFLRDLRNSDMTTTEPNTSLRLTHHVLTYSDQLYEPDVANDILTTAHSSRADADEVRNVCNELVRLGVAPPRVCRE